MRPFMLSRGLVPFYVVSCLVGCSHGTPAPATATSPASPTQPARLAAEWIGFKDGCNFFSYEYYGYHTFARCGDGRQAPGVSQNIEALFDIGGCRGFRFEYGGWHHFVYCRRAIESPWQQSRLDQPIEPVLAFGDCRVRRYEYYGWHHYLECNQQLPWSGSSPLVVEALFSFADCDAYRYDYFGWHYVIRCEPHRRWPPMARSSLVEPVQTLGSFGDCTAHRFEYYGWHDFVRCANRPVATITSLGQCGRGVGIPAGPVTLHFGQYGASACGAPDETVVTIGENATTMGP